MFRTYTKAEFDAAQQLWADGDFSDEWRDVRHLAAMGGILWPPTGTNWDSWEDDEPSQRAMLIRAIRETPKLLDRCIVGARSWAEVIERLLRQRDEWRDLRRLEDADEARRRADDPDAVGHDESVQTLAGILARIDEAR